MRFLPKKISPLDKSFFYRQFANLITSGLPLTDIFAILQQDLDNSRFEKVIKKIHQDLERNVPLHDSFARQGKHFGKLAPELLRTCDQFGALKAALLMLARDQDWNHLIKKVRRNLLFWPLSYLTGIILLLNLMMIFVIPVFEEMFNSLGGELPLPTAFVISVARWWWISLILTGFIVIVWFLKNRLNRLAVIVDWIVVKLPLVGRLSKKIASAKFVHTFALLVQTEVPIAKTLEIAARSADNTLLVKKFSRIEHDLNSGISLSKALRNCAAVPKRLTQIAAIADKGGSVEDMAGWIEALYSEMYVEDLMKFQNTMQFMLKWIIGLTIAVVAISLYLPIFKMGGAL
jgi:type IV pilus assembly protein PilC